MTWLRDNNTHLNKKPTVASPIEPVVSLPCSITCYDCDAVTRFGWDDTHTTCDIVNGQYTEVDAINCQKCGLENLI